MLAGNTPKPQVRVSRAILVLLLAFAATGLILCRPLASAVSGLPRYIDEFPVPTPNAAPLALTVDPHGIVWFTESNASKLGRFDPATGTFTEYSVPGIGDMWGITVDQAGYIWLTQYSLKGSVNPGGAVEPGGNGRLIRFTPATGNFTIINIPTPGSFPFRITTDSQGRVWFTELLGNRIGSYDPSAGKLEEYSVPSQFAGPADLTFDNHGTLWFSEAYNESITRFDPRTDAFHEYHFYAIDANQYVGSPVGLAVTPDGIIWVADHGGSWIVEFNSTSQQITRYPTHEPPPQVYPISIPNDLLLAPDGKVWFAEHGGNSLGFFDPLTQRMVEYSVPTGPISTVLWISQAPNGDIWFTEWGAGKLGVLHTNLPVPLAVSASQNILSVGSGGESELSLEVSGPQGLSSTVEYAYSWTSYNAGDLSVTFTPQNVSLANSASASAQVAIKISPTIAPGTYMMGLGVAAGGVRVWTMLPTNVSPQPSATSALQSSPWLPFIALFGLVVAVVLLEIRLRASKRHKNPRRR